MATVATISPSSGSSLNPRPPKHRPPKSDPAEVFQDTYSLDWLFDPDRCYDHLPLEEQLKMYKHRDLIPGKLFRFATKIFGAPKSRKRVIIAPPMQTISQDIGYRPSPVTMNSQLNRQLPAQPREQDSKLEAVEDPVAAYRDWLTGRRAFRNSLETMGLNEEWLTRKPNKTPLEQRVLRRMLEEKYPHVPTPPPREETPVEPVLPEEPPVICRPSPLAIRVIEKLLREKQMRLIDLFASVDKNKNWKVSRDEFRQAIREANIPISDVLLEDLIQALDQDLNNLLDYRELAKGMELWKLEKRESKRKLLASGAMSSCPKTYSTLSGFESPEKESFSELGGSGSNFAKSNSSPNATNAGYDEQTGLPSRVKSALSTISSGSSQYLELPELDLRQEQLVLSSDEAMVEGRKRDKNVLRMASKKSKKDSSSDQEVPGMVKTGDPYIDAHCQPSTLSGETGELVNRFRQLQFREYNDICQLCREKNMPFTEELLTKVLLYPPDKPHSVLKKQICQPGMPLLSTSFAKPQKRPKSPAQEQRRAQVKMSKSRKAFRDARSAYPSRNDMSKGRTRVNLSTGKAVISSQVNCWMTYEEYDKLTSHLATRYTRIHGRTSDNAFWPGHLLDKMRLCMPDAEPKSSSVFVSVKDTQRRAYPGYNNDLLTWPINSKGYIQYGLIDPYANKYI